MPTQKELMNQASEQYGVGGNSSFFQFDKSGEYRLRLLTAAYPIATHFFGKGVPAKVCYGADKGCPFHGEKAPKDEKTGAEKKPSVKFSAYVVDRKDGNKVKLAELPWSVIKVVTDFQEDEDYAFADFPMPYDLKIKFDKEASASDMYKTYAAPNRGDVEPEIMEDFLVKNRKQTPEQYVEQKKQREQNKENGDKSLDELANQQYDGADYPEYSGNPTI